MVKEGNDAGFSEETYRIGLYGIDYNDKTKDLINQLEICTDEEHTNLALKVFNKLQSMGCIEQLDSYSYNIDEDLKEDTHAKYAKPEGDRISSYNNALKYAKQENKPYIYGYTNYTGKFFALNQPIKCIDPTTKEDTQKFKDQYKNCVTIYMVYPDKEPILV